MKWWRKLQCLFNGEPFYYGNEHLGPFTEIGYMAYRCEHCKSEFDVYL